MLKAPVRVNFPSFTASRYSGASFPNVNVASSPASTLVPCRFTLPSRRALPFAESRHAKRTPPPGISTRQPIVDSREDTRAAAANWASPSSRRSMSCALKNCASPRTRRFVNSSPSDGHTSSGARAAKGSNRAATFTIDKPLTPTSPSRALRFGISGLGIAMPAGQRTWLASLSAAAAAVRKAGAAASNARSPLKRY